MDFAAVLDDCLERMAAGESLLACLARYPQHAAELRPLLELAEQVQAAPPPISAAALQRGRAAMHRAAAEAPVRRGLVGWPAAPRFSLLAALALLILFGVLTATGRPGAPMFPLRQGVETAASYLIADPAARAARRLQLAQRRLEQAESLWQTQQRLEPSLIADIVTQAEMALGDLTRLEQPLPASDLPGQLLAFHAEARGWLGGIADLVPPAQRHLVDTTAARLDRLERWTRAIIHDPALLPSYRADAEPPRLPAQLLIETPLPPSAPVTPPSPALGAEPATSTPTAVATAQIATATPTSAAATATPTATQRGTLAAATPTRPPQATSTPRPPVTPTPTAAAGSQPPDTTQPPSTPTPTATTQPTPPPAATATPTLRPSPTAGASATPTPTARPSATPTRTPRPTATAEPNRTEPPSATPTPRPEPTATRSPTTTPTREPTATRPPTATPTRQPTPTPSPTKTPEPTKTPTPTKTPEPTKTPTPTKTPKP